MSSLSVSSSVNSVNSVKSSVSKASSVADSVVQPSVSRLMGTMGNHMMLIAMVLICGVNIYIAIQMKKRMDKADSLLDDMAQVAGTSADLERLTTAIKVEPTPVLQPVLQPVQPVSTEKVESDETSSSVATSEITLLKTLPPKKRAKKNVKS